MSMPLQLYEVTHQSNAWYWLLLNECPKYDITAFGMHEFTKRSGDRLQDLF